MMGITAHTFDQLEEFFRDALRNGFLSPNEVQMIKRMRRQDWEYTVATADENA